MTMDQIYILVADDKALQAEGGGVREMSTESAIQEGLIPEDKIIKGGSLASRIRKMEEEQQRKEKRRRRRERRAAQRATE